MKTTSWYTFCLVAFYLLSFPVQTENIDALAFLRYLHTHIYIYIYIQREKRQRVRNRCDKKTRSDRGKDMAKRCTPLSRFFPAQWVSVITGPLCCMVPLCWVLNVILASRLFRCRSELFVCVGWGAKVRVVHPNFSAPHTCHLRLTLHSSGRWLQSARKRLRQAKREH